MSTLPDFKKGIDYWTGVDATVDGVLGGFGEGVSRQPPRPRRILETQFTMLDRQPLPRVEQLSSRLFLLSLLPQLQTFNSPLSASMHQQLSKNKRYLALDVGAGVGRVTKHTLLPLVDDVVTTEPVKHFIETAKREATEGKWTFLEDRSENAVTSSSRQTPAGSGGKKRSHSPEPEEEDEDVQYDKLGNIIPKTKPAWTTVKGKRVWFVQASLNDLNPARPLDGHEAKSLGVVGGGAAGGGGKDFGEKREEDLEFDVYVLLIFSQQVRLGNRCLYSPPSIPSEYGVNGVWAICPIRNLWLF
jgi:protein N-terminal methyltransferase